MAQARYDFDLFTIGAGSAGVRACRVAAGYGARVAVAEERQLGGTCVNVGCIPKKLLVYAAQFREAFEEAAGFGWMVGARSLQWPQLIANKNREIARLNEVYRSLLEQARVQCIEGHAITSNEAFFLERAPERVLIVGGGYVAVEFAGIFHGIGKTLPTGQRADHRHHDNQAELSWPLEWTAHVGRDACRQHSRSTRSQGSIDLSNPVGAKPRRATNRSCSTRTPALWRTT